MALYQEISNKIRTAIDNGVYLPGSRLPGVRRLSQQFGVSISTIIQAQRQLENIGLIEARPRSGYYVTHHPWIKPEQPTLSQPELKPSPVIGQELVLQLSQLANQVDFVHLGAAVPDPSFMPVRAFQRSLAKTIRQESLRATEYAFPPGITELRQQISHRMYHVGCQVESESVLITNGCQEAISLALQMVAKAGDIIAIESPTFYALLQVIESLGMKALEIPTDPRDGISLAALELALEQWSVKACVITPNFSNPLGGLMPDNNKQQLVALAKKHSLMLIEDDIYSDLSYKGEYPKSLLSFTQADDSHVIYCSSFSKTISQGLRIGWMVVPPHLFHQAEYLKYVSNLAAPTLNQLALANFLQHGGYDRHLRQIQLRYEQQISLFTNAVSKYFPAESYVTQPQGGFVLWIELPEEINTLQLSHRMLEHKVSIAPGQIFSAMQKYQNCFRLNCAQVWSVKIERALIQLSKEIDFLLS